MSAAIDVLQQAAEEAVEAAELAACIEVEDEDETGESSGGAE
jgi:hypothetical protein